jgi:hypothetical protein
MPFCSVHQELLEKQKTANPSGRRFQSSGGDLFGEFPHHTSSGISFPIKGTSALHCQVARLLFESFLMLAVSLSKFVLSRNRILCHSEQSDWNNGD